MGVCTIYLGVSIERAAQVARPSLRTHALGVATKPNWIVAKFVLGLVLCSVVSCAGSSRRVNEVQLVNQRLQGTWVLQSYRPFTALELPLVALVTLQLGQMHVVIGGTQITAEGPGVQLLRNYQVLEANEQSATLVVSESTGASVRVRIEIQGNLLTFHPLDAPWSGEGTLQRL